MSKLRGFNQFQAMINCLEPDIIVNPKLFELIERYHNYVLNGHLYHLTVTPFGVHNFDISRFHPDVTHVCLDNLKDFYVVDMSSGEVFPIYFVVPCGHCVICQEAKCSNFARRCQYETQLYDCPPIHLTMTLDEAHVGDYNVSVRDIQLWKKRVRTMLVDNLMYPHSPRMAVAAEYGTKNTHRPHYHVLIWNMPEEGVFTYDVLRELLWRMWYKEGDPLQEPMCKLRRFSFMPITADYIPKGSTKSLRMMGKTQYQAFGYVAKYFYKDSPVPPGRTPTFHLMSKSKALGGIGAPFIDKHKAAIRCELFKEYHYFDKWNQEVQSMPYDRYLLNRVLPSRYMSVPVRVRQELRRVCRYLHNCLEPRFLDEFSIVSDKLGQLYPILLVMEPRDSYCFRGKTSCPLIRQFSRWTVSRSLYYLLRVVSEIDVGEVLSLDRKRALLLSKLFRNKLPQDVYRRYQRIMHRRHRRKEEFTQL